MNIYLSSLMIPSSRFVQPFFVRRGDFERKGWKEMDGARVGDHCMDHTDDGVDGDAWYETGWQNLAAFRRGQKWP